MTDERRNPAWYWPKGLHDARILSVCLQDGTLSLRLDSRGAMYDSQVETITFYDARLKTPLPEPTKKRPVYWLSDELTELPFAQWKLCVQMECLEEGKTFRKPLIVIFRDAETKRRGKPAEQSKTEREPTDGL